ncbi:hypothetical protein [Mesoflavibacter profundi]|uniref:hypothetical protein n=1 Tax=Mesoflavibacter profundi TaxID=2708110 RepID=UPI00168B188C|nr:hypothetical protein [Mesoflavibacter profundi]
MRIQLTIILIFVYNSLLFAQEIEPDKFLEKCEVEYKTLLNQLTKSDFEIWESKLRDIQLESIKLTDSIETYKEIYTKINAEHIYSFKYLNVMYGYVLPRKVRTINNLSSKIINDSILTKLLVKRDSLRISLNKYANTENASKFGRTFNNFLLASNELDEINKAKDTLLSINYQPQDNPYDESYKTQNYVVYEWKNKIRKLSDLDKKFNDLRIELTSNEYGLIKEPNPIIPTIFQFATLLVLISNLLVNFGFKAKTKVVFYMVIISLITSVILLLSSENTILNTLINIIVPGIMYLFYYKRKKPVANNV